MSDKPRSHKNLKTELSNHNDAKKDPMSKTDRKQLVLAYLAHKRMALPPAVLYRNLRLQMNATFSQKSLDNYLSELAAEGLLMRVDPDAMADRELVEVDSGRGYWIATEKGREQANGSFSFQ